jgi:hypothetical protein
MILRLTPKTAALVGETPAEWQLPPGNGGNDMKHFSAKSAKPSVSPRQRRQSPLKVSANAVLHHRH